MRKIIIVAMWLCIICFSIDVSLAESTTCTHYYSGTGHCYLPVLATGGINWDNAKTAAESAGGYLATITSSGENDFVYSLVSSNDAFWFQDAYSNGAGPWLGGYQPAASPEPAGGWTWVMGETWIYSNWASSQPDNGSGGENSLNYFAWGALKGNQWNDVHNSALLNGYVIEFDNSTCTTPPSDMVSWWPGDNSAIDIQGSNNGTLMNGTTFATGIVGEAFSFDGSNDYVAIPDGIIPYTARNFTVDAWAYANATDGSRWIVYAGAHAGEYLLGVANGEYLFDVHLSNGTWYSVRTPASTNEWALVTGVRRGDSIEIWVNGALMNSTPILDLDLIVVPGFHSSIGSYSEGSQAFWNGLIDEVEIFNRSLSQTEIQDIYHAGAAGKCRSCVTPPSNMVSWWSGDGHPFDLVGDNDGTLMGSATYANGKVEKAVSFTGSEFVSIPDSSSLDFTGSDFSIDAWIYPTNIDLYGEGITGRLALENASGWGFAIQGNQYGNYGKLNFFAINAWAGPSNDTITTNVWTHVSVTRSGDTLTYYINGNPSGSYTFAGNFDNDLSLAIGEMYTTWTESVWRFNGLIDEVEIFNRALNAEEIAAMYAASSAGKCKPCFDPPSDMVSWWTGDDTADDIIDSNHGSLINGATYADGKVRRAFSFDGSDDYVDLPDASSVLLSNSAGAITAWVNPTVIGGNDIIAAFGSGVNGQGIGLGIFGNVRIYHHTGTYDWQSSTAVSANEWTFLAYTWDGTTERIYKNGAFSESRARNFSYVPGHGRIGHGFWDDPANAFPGRIDEVEIYTRTLSAEEIAAIYAAGSAGKCKTASDADGDGVPDASDNCPSAANPGQEDGDTDGIGNACDNCLSVANTNQADTDSDGVGDTCDNCLSTANSNQADGDVDGVGDACDNCSALANSGQEDTDLDGIGNVCDNCPAIANADQLDTEGDGTGDACDTDDDGDGVPDAVEDGAPNSGNGNNDATPDRLQGDVASLPTATGQGYMTLVVTGECRQFHNVQVFTEPQIPEDDSQHNYLYGLVGFELPSCETATVAITYHNAVDLTGMIYRKYGPMTPGDAGTTQWYDFPNAVIAGNVITLTLADNAIGDDTGDDGIIYDQGGPTDAKLIPTMTEWGMIIFMLFAGLGAIFFIRRQSKA